MCLRLVQPNSYHKWIFLLGTELIHQLMPPWPRFPLPVFEMCPSGLFCELILPVEEFLNGDNEGTWDPMRISVGFCYWCPLLPI